MCTFLVSLVVLLLASIAGNVYQFVNKTEDQDQKVVEAPICPQTISLQPGVQGHISCKLQYPTTTNPSIEIYQISTYTNERVTHISEQQLLTSEGVVKNSSESGTITEVKVDANGYIEVQIMYDTVKCCSHGDLNINVSGHVIVNIEVNVQVDLPCHQNPSHNVNTFNVISCTKCLCSDNSTVQPAPTGTWIVNHTSITNTPIQPGRVTAEQTFDNSTSLITYSLLFNRTACFDGGSYTLIIPGSQDDTQRLEFNLQIPGVTFGPLSTLKTVSLLSEVLVGGMDVCISNDPASYLSSHNVTYMFNGNEDSLEILQAENMSIVSNTREGLITSIPAAQKSFVFIQYIQNTTQCRLRYDNGLLSIDVYFNKAQCQHGGQYEFYVDDVILYNLTVSIDDSAERSQSGIYQKGEETGFVETYDITIECAARVGCTKRALVIEPEIDTNMNTTFNHTLTDVNSDGQMDVFVATVTSTVLGIPLTLNNTNITCSVTDDVTQELVYTIYVLEGTFCDSRPKNCEYEYPYRTDSTCELWVSCLDRPRVKMCNHNLYYHKGNDQCNGMCSYECPWNL